MYPYSSQARSLILGIGSSINEQWCSIISRRAFELNPRLNRHRTKIRPHFAFLISRKPLKSDTVTFLAGTVHSREQSSVVRPSPYATQIREVYLYTVSLKPKLQVPHILKPDEVVIKFQDYCSSSKETGIISESFTSVPKPVVSVQHIVLTEVQAGQFGEIVKLDSISESLRIRSSTQTLMKSSRSEDRWGGEYE